MCGAVAFPLWLDSMPTVHPYTLLEQLLLSASQCAQLCMRRSCIAMVHNADQECHLVVGEGHVSPPSALFRCCVEVPITNVALGKPCSASSVYANYPPSEATNGIFQEVGKFFHSSNTKPFPFLVVDLGTLYAIEAVMLMPRLTTYADRFKDIEIRAGVTEEKGPDFSSYTLLAHFPGPAPNPVTWMVKNLTETVQGRYVSVQRATTTGDNYLEITELRIAVLLLAATAMAQPEPILNIAGSLTGSVGGQSSRFTTVVAPLPDPAENAPPSPDTSVPAGQGGLLSSVLGGQSGGLLEGLLGGDGLVGGLVSGLVGPLLSGGGLLSGVLGGGNGGLLSSVLGGGSASGLGIGVSGAVGQVGDVVTCVLSQLLGQVGGLLDQILGPVLGALGLQSNTADAADVVASIIKGITSGNVNLQDIAKLISDGVLKINDVARLIAAEVLDFASFAQLVAGKIISPQALAALLSMGSINVQVLQSLVSNGIISFLLSAQIQASAAAMSVASQ
ncbi:Galactose-binding domain-like [Trinorchestia longiramus]|nr:Galactose-binding domain-like [Trinorchestia longiramus]